MKVILLRDIPKVGHKFETVEVPNGYARGLLIRNGSAVYATTQEIKRMESKKLVFEREKAAQRELAEKALENIGKEELVFLSKTNEKGSLFAGIGKREIQKLLEEKLHINIPEENILLDTPIKEIGSHPIKIGYGEKEIELVVTVKKEGSENETEKGKTLK